jgi:hypothetical protein
MVNLIHKGSVVKSKRLTVVLTVLAVIVLFAFALSMLASSMSKPIGRDEHMYCTAGVLLAQGKTIYRDFAYVAQLPYHPLLLAALYKSLGTTHYLLVGRFASVVCDVLVAMLIVMVYYRAFEGFRLTGMLLGVCAATSYVYNPAVDYANGYAWNNDVVVLCVVASFLLFIGGDGRTKFAGWRSAAIGALLTLATCMRMTSAVVVIVFLLALLARSAPARAQRIKTALPFLIAASILLIWPVYLLARAPKAFLIDVFRIHVLNSQWLHQIKMVPDKWQLTRMYVSLPGYFMLIVVGAYLLLAVLFASRKSKPPQLVNILLGVMLPIAFFIIALILPTIWQQYLAVPVPFLLIGFACPLAFLKDAASRAISLAYFRAAVVLMILGALVAVYFGPDALQRTSLLAEPSSWVPIQLHKTSQDIAQNSKGRRLALTLSPLFALEGGCEIYPEFSAGVFAYRIGDMMTDGERNITRTAGPKDLPRLVEQSPPSVVIVGAEPRRFAFLEETFQAFVGPDWSKRVYSDGLVVFFRP